MLMSPRHRQGTEKDFSKVGFSAPNALTRFANESSDRNVSKLVLEIKVPSNVVSDTALRGLAAKLHSGDVLRGCQHRSAQLRKEGVTFYSHLRHGQCRFDMCALAGAVSSFGRFHLRAQAEVATCCRGVSHKRVLSRPKLDSACLPKRTQDLPRTARGQSEGRFPHCDPSLVDDSKHLLN
jgi:hypothetical protein